METRKNPTISMVSKALAKRIDKQCKQYKAERDKLEVENEKLKEENEELREQILEITEYMEE